MLIKKNGFKHYFKDIVKKDITTHNSYGFAIITSCGKRCYRINGFLHNELGPAMKWSDGYEDYYLNGKLFFYNNWLIARNECIK